MSDKGKSDSSELKAEFETITPVFTGDAWGDGDEIKKSSILGGLRFWFEVFLGNSKLDNKENNKGNDKKNNKENYRKLLKENFLQISDTRKDKKNIFKGNLVDFVFGTNGWKGLIRINNIKYNKGKKTDFVGNNKLDDNWSKTNGKKQKLLNGRANNQGYYYPKKNDLFYIKFKIDLNKVIKKYSFFQKNSIEGLKVSENKLTEELNNILNSYLDFLNYFGYIGGKWNLGLGRIQKIKDNEINHKKSDYIIKEDKLTTKNIKNKIKNERDKLVLFLDTDDSFNGKIADLFKKIKQKQNELRGGYRDGGSLFNDRHKLFGYTTDKNKNCRGCKKSSELVKNKKSIGSKLLPWIYKIDDKYSYGFFNISMINNLSNNGNNNDT